VKEAWALFGLFISQFVLGALLPDSAKEFERIAVGIVYLALAVGMLVVNRAAIRPLVHDGLREPVGELFHEEPPDEARSLP
jgi:hypothetical protein